MSGTSVVRAGELKDLQRRAFTVLGPWGRAALRRRWRDATAGLLPAAAEGFVELHEALIFGAARLRQSDFCFKERPLTVQHFQIRGRAAFVTHDGEAHRLR